MANQNLPLFDNRVPYQVKACLRTYNRKTGKNEHSLTFEIGQRELFIDHRGVYYTSNKNRNTRLYGVSRGHLRDCLNPDLVLPYHYFDMEEEIILYDDKNLVITLFNPSFTASLARIIEIHGITITQFIHESYITDYVSRNNKTPYLKKVS